MTNKELCMHQWNWIASMPDGTSKEDWVDAFPKLSKKLEGHSYCAACLVDSFYQDACSNCPIIWIKGKRKQPGVCTNKGSPYLKWFIHSTQTNASKVRNCIKRTWKD